MRDRWFDRIVTYTSTNTTSGYEIGIELTRYHHLDILHLLLSKIIVSLNLYDG